MKKEIKLLPEGFVEYDGDELMSNFNHRIEKETAEAIKGKKLFSRYAGWNFNGLVWWQDDQWHCAVFCYGAYIETASENTLEEIMKTVSDKFGYE